MGRAAHGALCALAEKLAQHARLTAQESGVHRFVLVIEFCVLRVGGFVLIADLFELAEVAQKLLVIVRQRIESAKLFIGVLLFALQSRVLCPHAIQLLRTPAEGIRLLRQMFAALLEL